jgi:hypothetical protein
MSEQTQQAEAAVDPQVLADLDRAAGEFTAEDVPGGTVGDYPAEADAQLEGAITGCLMVTFGLLQRVRGEHWGLGPAEAAEAGKAYAAVLNKYFPGVGGGVEVTAILVTAGLVVPRLMMDKAAEAEAEIRRQQGESGGDQSEQ